MFEGSKGSQTAHHLQARDCATPTAAATMPFEASPRPARGRSEADKPPRHLVEQLLTISKATRALAGLHLARIDLEIGQDHFLTAVDGVGTASTSELGVLMSVRPSTVSKMADRLARKGFIRRMNDENDARRALLQLTDDGKRKCSEIHACWDRIEASLTKCHPSIADDDIAQALDTIDHALQTQLLRLR